MTQKDVIALGIPVIGPCVGLNVTLPKDAVSVGENLAVKVMVRTVIQTY